MKNIVTIGGGSGTFMVLSALKQHPVNLAAIVTMADDGGSTGSLRDQYGVLPPGDIRRALVALSEESETLRELFNYRFKHGGLDGHSFGNLFLSALEKVTGSFSLAIEEASRILNVRGEVVPVTYDDVRLCARLTNGKIIRGETNIDIPKQPSRPGIAEVWLEPEARLNAAARRVLHNANLIIIGPGDLYTSIVPNFLVKGLREEIKRSKAKKVFICNLMTKHGETDGFRAEDFLREMEKYAGGNIFDFALFNNKKPSASILARYKKEKAEFIEQPHAHAGLPKFVLGDLVDTGRFVRHGPQKKFAKILLSLL